MSLRVSLVRTIVVTGALVLVAAGCRTIQFGRSGTADCTSAANPGVAQVEQNETQSFDRPFPAPATSPHEAADSPLRADSPDDASHSESGDGVSSEGAPPVPPDPEVIASRLEARGAQLTRDAFQSVVTIDLSNTGVIDDDLEHIGEFRDLKQLNLAGTRITNVCLDHLAQCGRLEFLGLMGTRVDDDGVGKIAQFRQLRFVSLAGTNVSDAGLISLSRLRTLEAVNLRSTRATADGVAALQAGLPNCRIVFEARSESDSPAPNRGDSAGRGRETSSRQDGGSSASAVGDSLDVRRLYPGPDRATAQRQLELVLRQKLSDPEVLHALAAVRAAEGNWHEAGVTLRAALDQMPYDAGLQFDHAVALARCYELERAFEQFACAVGRPAAHYNLGVLLVEQGRGGAARDHFQQAIALDPTLDAAREWLAFVNHDGPQSPHDDDGGPGLMTDQQFRSYFGSLLGAEPSLRDELTIRPIEASGNADEPHLSPFSSALAPMWSSAAGGR